jgi:hypothetical protein
VTERRSEILRARIRILQRRQKGVPHFELASVGMLRDEAPATWILSPSAFVTPRRVLSRGSPSFLSALQSVSRVTPAARAMLFLINSLLSPLLMRGLFSTRMAQPIRPATQTLPTSPMHH